MKVECSQLLQFRSLKHGFFEANGTDPEACEISFIGHVIPLITLRQVHGNKVHIVNSPLDNRKEGDGLVTKEKGIALGIKTADCGPILFYDPEAHVIGGCHAGWRGAKLGILQATVKAMEDLGASRSRIHAALGPTIHQENYEVGPEFPDLINGVYEAYFFPSHKKGHHFFNLPRYICDQLLKENLASVQDVKYDTFSGNFHSRRRSLFEENATPGFSNNLSVIAIL